MKVAYPTKKLGELCTIARGGSPRPIQSYLTSDATGINWVKISDATASDKYIEFTKEKIRPEGLKKSRLVKAGDFILSNSMSFGRPYIMKTTGCIHDGWLVLSDKCGLFDQDYLYHFLGSDAAYRQFDRLAAGSTVRNLNSDLVKTVDVPLPPLEEQRRIVAVLDDAFAAIATARTNAEKNVANARDLFDRLMSDAFSVQGSDIQNGRMDDTSLVQIIDGDRGANYPKSSDFFEFEHCLFLSTKNVRPDGFKFDETIFITKEKDAQLRKGKLQRHDVVMTTRGTIGNIGYYSDDVSYDDIRINSGMLIFRANAERIVPAFLFELLRSPLFLDQVRSRTSGAAQPQLPINTIKHFTFLLPEKLADQHAIVAAIKKFSVQTRSLELAYSSKLQALVTLKQSLLNRAFAGELSTTSNVAIAA